MEYGGTIEFEADTNRTDNTDETWVFLSGGWGEVRLGDEDDVADNSVVGAQVIAAGTGGIDGSDAVISAAPVVFLTNSNDATKIRYYTPSFGGFSVGVELHADADGPQQRRQQRQFLRPQGRRPRDGRQEHRRGRPGLRRRVRRHRLRWPVVGVYGELKNDAETCSATTSGGRAGRRLVRPVRLQARRQRRHRQRRRHHADFFTAGIGAALGPVNTSVTYGQIFNTNSDFDEATGIGDKAYNLVLVSADIALARAGAGGRRESFDNDTTVDTGTGDEGWTAVGSVRLAF